MPTEASGHVDTFARDNLPPRSLWPEMDYGVLPELAAYPARINAGAVLIDEMAQGAQAERPAIYFGEALWSYRALLENAGRIASVLTERFGLVPGNRVLLRASNHPTLVAACLAVLKAGGVVIPTMPVMRERELSYVLDKAQVGFAICDEKLSEDLLAAAKSSESLEHVVLFGADEPEGLEALMAEASPEFQNADTAADDVALIGFTSGSTGTPKGTVHFHRDLLAVADTFPKYLFGLGPDDVVCGSPQIAFLYGFCAFITDALRFGASSVLLERGTPRDLLEAVERYKGTVCFSTPSGYKQMLDFADGYDLGSLRACIAGGESLEPSVFREWRERTGVSIINGLGISELLHIFISASGVDIRPGKIGRAAPGYKVRVVDEEMRDTPPGEVGQMIVKGPTGCRYLDDLERQRNYVRDGWNMTGDLCRVDEEGYISFEARTDDMINTGGYNVSGLEVEAVLLEHAIVRECAVVGSPNAERGEIVKAFVVLTGGAGAGSEHAQDALVQELQDFVKAQLAPYKYPRAMEFLECLPLTATGKIQRGALRKLEKERAEDGAD
ncbi:MAG: AMP-binding protein [Nitrospinae bacterium]|nr:AMP-binding protein [Nitrospinota bacterium]